MKTGFSKLIWGVFLLLAAVFVLANQFGGFAELGIGTVIAGLLVLVLIVHCIADSDFALLPVPLAVLYIIIQRPLGLTYIKPWTLIIASILAFVGLHILLPRKDSNNRRKHTSGPDNWQIKTENGPNDNNPSVSVQFGALSRRLSADSLTTASLSCNFGALELYFDQAELNPGGAEAIIACNFGAMKLHIPKNWRVINRLTCSLGGVEEHGGASPEEGAPQLTLVGRVSFGGIEIKYQ